MVRFQDAPADVSHVNLLLSTVQYRGIDTRVSSPYTRLSEQML